MPKDNAAAAVVAQVAPTGQTSALTLADANDLIKRQIDARHDELATKLAGSYRPDYFAGLVLTQLRRLDPAVQLAIASTPQGRTSLIAAMYQAAEMGLPFLLGRMYLVPVKVNGRQEVQARLGYQGLADLVTAPGTGVTFVEAAAVRALDDFDYQRGTDAFLRHREFRPTLGPTAKQEEWVVDRGPRVAFWARVVFDNEQSRFDVMSYAEVDAIRRRSPAGKAGPWVTDYDEMGKKTVLRRLCKTQRISLRAMEALDREDDFDADVTPVASDAQAKLRRQVQDRVSPTPTPVRVLTPEPDETPGPALPGAPQDDVQDPSPLTYGQAADLGVMTPGVDFPTSVSPDAPVTDDDDEDALLAELVEAESVPLGFDDDDRQVDVETGEIIDPEPDPEPEPAPAPVPDPTPAPKADTKVKAEPKPRTAVSPPDVMHQCESTSPWEDGVRCKKAAGHQGSHRTETSSW